MTDNALENGEQETVVPSPEVDEDKALWDEIRNLEKDQADKPAGPEDRQDDEPEDDNQEDDPKDTGKQQGPPDPKDTGSPETAKPDEWEGIPEPVRARLEALQEENQKLEKRVRTEVGRVAKTQQRIAELQKVIQSAGKPDEGTPDRKALEQLKEDYPEVYGAVEVLDKTVQKMSDKERERVVDAERELQELYQSNSRQVDEDHPDRHDLLKTHGEQFQAWVMHPQQSVAIREAALSNAKVITNPQAASAVIEQFKQYLAYQQQHQQAQQPATPPQATNPAPQSQPNDRRQRQLQGTAAPKNGGRAPTVSGIPEDGDPEQIWAALREQERRQSR